MVLQEEIRVLYHYFGKAIFDSMVPHHKKIQRTAAIQFNDDDICKTQSIFERALGLAIERRFPSPPLVYIGFSSKLYTSENLFSAIRSVKVANDKGMQLNIREYTCIKCGVSIKLADVKGRKERISVSNSERAVTVLYEDSECHPKFRSRYSEIEKMIGGIAH